MVTVTAPGKLMLFGEHAVIYGHPCIATAVSERLSLAIEQTDDGKVVIDAPQVKDTRFLSEAISQGCGAWGITHRGIHIKTQSSLNGYGFGSSSAVTAGALFALARVFGRKVEKRELFDLSYKTVLAVQGVGSGFDVAAAVYGGTIFFIKGGAVIEPIQLKKENEAAFIVGYSGVKADTVEIVNNIAKKREQYQKRVDRIFEAIHDVVEKAKKSCEEGDWGTVGKYMNFNQEYLRDLGVSTEKLEAMIAASKKAGAYGAKLSGAGGGDCMIAIAPKEKKDAVGKAITEAGGEVVDVTCGAEGVRLE